MCFRLSKCCFCFPLRPGLLTFGYIMAGICYINLLSMIFRMNDLFQGVTKSDPMDYIILSLAFAITAVQFIFNVIFVAALHKNNSEFLQAYYECSVCMLATQITVAVFYIPLQVYRWRSFEAYVWWLTIGMVLIAASSIAVQFYLVSLIRSQLQILKGAEELDVEAGMRLTYQPIAGPSDDKGGTK